MDEPAKYVIRGTVSTNGVVERSDVVGAIFGQTEGLLGEEFDIRSLQESDRVGRIEVDIDSVGGRSTGTVAIATEMDRTETAVLAASLETIDRVGPAQATIVVDRIEDVRAAKRRRIVERARELLVDGFEDVGLGGRDLVETVRQATTPAEISEFANLPAGPDVADASDIIVVEGRADVLQLLDYGITNVIGVEGTGVSDEVASLTEERTTTAFFDGDRGGDLLLLELAQIGDIDYVTFAPPGRSVEDLSMAEATDALARKVPYQGEEPFDPEEYERTSHATSEQSLLQIVEETIGTGTGDVRILDANRAIIGSGERDEVATLLEDAADDSWAIVLDGTVDQALVDVAAQRDIELIVGRDRGGFVKRPIDVRVLTADELDVDEETVDEASV